MYRWYVIYYTLYIVFLYVASKLDALTMDVIAGTAFGINAETQMYPDGPFMTNGTNLTKSFTDASGIKALTWALLSCKIRFHFHFHFPGSHIHTVQHQESSLPIAL